MNVFLEYLSKQYEEDIILLICDGAVCHKSKELDIPKNIKIGHIPPTHLRTNMKKNPLYGI